MFGSVLQRTTYTDTSGQQWVTVIYRNGKSERFKAKINPFNRKQQGTLAASGICALAATAIGNLGIAAMGTAVSVPVAATVGTVVAGGAVITALAAD